MNLVILAESPVVPRTVTAPESLTPVSTDGADRKTETETESTEVPVSTGFSPKRVFSSVSEESSNTDRGIDETRSERSETETETFSGEAKLERHSVQDSGMAVDAGQGMMFHSSNFSQIPSSMANFAEKFGKQKRGDVAEIRKSTKNTGGPICSVSSEGESSTKTSDAIIIGASMLCINTSDSSTPDTPEANFLGLDTPNTSTDDTLTAGSMCVNTTNSSTTDTTHANSLCLDSKNSSSPDITAGRKPSSNGATSCEQRCGEDTNFPCSCSEKCVVLKTCCEDIPQTCPELHGHALAKFQHLVSASVRCDEITAVILVESCPKLDPTCDGESSDENLTPSFPSEKIPREDGAGGEDSLTKLLSSAPVTDYNTGIIYANASIYHCNQPANAILSGQNSTNNTGTWKAQARRSSRPHPTYNIVDINRSIDLSRYSFVPPLSHPPTAGSLCYRNWTLSCIDKSSLDQRIPQLTCNMSVTDYYRLLSGIPSVSGSIRSFDKDICASCLSSFQTTVKFRNFFSGFRVMMSLSETPGNVVYDLQQNAQHVRPSLPWLSWTCPAQYSTMNQSSAQPCKALRCSLGYHVTSGGFCRKALLSEFSIQEVILYRHKRCRIDPKAFAEVTTCCLREIFNVKVMDTPHLYYTVFEDRLKVNLTVIRMDMYADVDSFSHHWLNLLKKKEVLEPVMQLFVRLHCSRIEELIGTTNTQRQQNSLTAPSQDGVNSFKSGTSGEKGLSSVNTESTETVDSSTFFFKHCLQVYDLDESLSDSLNCHMSGESNISLNYIDMTDLDSRVRIGDSGCLDGADVETHLEYRSKGSRTCLLPSLLYLYIMLSLVYWLR